MGSLKKFDYVIAGASSAGCVLANRLSSDSQVRVLILEAGGRDNDVPIQMPGGALKLLPSQRHNWYYTTEPQPYAENRTLYWPRGKVLGGSSSINVLLYIRGHAADYDAWAATGNRGWSWDEVLPYFKRSEKRIPTEPKWHGTSGPLLVAPSEIHSPLVEAFLKAGQSAGYPMIPDFKSESQKGIGIYDKNIYRGQRLQLGCGLPAPRAQPDKKSEFSWIESDRRDLPPARKTGSSVSHPGIPFGLGDGEHAASANAVWSGSG